MNWSEAMEQVREERPEVLTEELANAMASASMAPPPHIYPISKFELGNGLVYWLLDGEYRRDDVALNRLAETGRLR